MYSLSEGRLLMIDSQLETNGSHINAEMISIMIIKNKPICKKGTKYLAPPAQNISQLGSFFSMVKSNPPFIKTLKTIQIKASHGRPPVSILTKSPCTFAKSEMTVWS